MQDKNSKYRALTDKVVEWQDTKNDSLIPEIQKLCFRMIPAVLTMYKCQNMPLLEKEELELDCQTVVFVKALTSFNRDRGAKFSTHFEWLLKSHIRSRRGHAIRRDKLARAVSLNTPISSENDIGHIDEVSDSTYSKRNLEQFKRTFKQIFE